MSLTLSRTSGDEALNVEEIESFPRFFSLSFYQKRTFPRFFSSSSSSFRAATPQGVERVSKPETSFSKLKKHFVEKKKKERERERERREGGGGGGGEAGGRHRGF